MTTKAERASALHDELQKWMIANYPRAPIDVIVAALTYELGRVLATGRPSDPTIRTVADNARDILVMQIRAHRDGRLPPIDV